MLGPGATPVAGMLVMVGANTAGATQGLNSVSQQMNGVAKGGQNAAGGLNSAMGIASAAIVGIGVASVKSAMTFEQSMRNVNSVAHLPEEQFQKLQDDVISFALTTRSSADNVAKSLYLVASAGLELDEKVKSVAVQTKDGVVQMSEAMAVMQASSRAAGAGLADVDEVSKLLISTMRAYGQDASQAGHITDVFLKVVQSGLVTLPDLANVMGRLAPMASNLGIPLEEVGYSFAQMTQTGLTAEQAATRLNAIFTQLIKPSESLQGVIEKLGYSSGTTMVEGMGGMIPALKAITTTVFESTESIGGMSKAQTTMSLKYPFLVDQMDIYKQELAKITEKEGEGSIAAQKKRLSMDKLNATMTQYQGELAKTTPAQQKLVKEFYGSNEGIADLFRNVRAIGGVMALTANETTMSTEAFAEWKKGIDGSVDAARAEQYKSLETQIKRLKVAFNVLGIEIGLTLIPPLTQLMDKVIIPLIRSFLPPLRTGLDAVQKAFESMPEPVQAITTALLALVFALKGAQYTLRPLLGLFGVQVPAIAALAGPLAIAAGAVMVFGVAYKKNLFGLKEATDKFVQGAKDGFAGFKTYLKDASETGNLTVESLYKLPKPIQGAAWQFANFRQALQAVVEDGHSLSEWLTEIDPLMNPVLAGIVSFVAALGDVISKGNDVLVENTQAMKDDLSDFFSTGFSDWSGFRAAFEGISAIVSETFGLLFENIAGWVRDRAPDIRNAFYQWAENAITWVTTFAANVIPQLADLLGQIIGWIIGTGVPTILGAGVLLVQGLAAGFQEGGKGQIFVDKLMASAILPGIARMENSINEAGAVLASHLYTGFNKALVTLFGQSKADAIMSGIEGAIAQLEAVFKPTFDRIGAAAKGFGDEIALLKPKFDELGQALMGLVGPASVIGQVIAIVGVVISKVFGELVAQTIERLPEIIGGVIDFVTGQVETFNNTFMGIVTTVKALLAGDWAGAWAAAKQTVEDYVTGSVASLEGLLVVVDNVAGGIYDSVVNTINDLTGATLPSWDQLKTGIVTKFTEIKASITGAIDEIKAKIEPIATALQPVFDLLAKVFGDIKTGFQEFLLELGPVSTALAPIKEALSGAFEGLKDALEVAKPGLLWLRDALLTVSGIILGVIGGSVVATVVAFGEILSGIFRNAGTIIRGFGQVLAGVFDVLRSIFYSFISVVKSIFEGDMDGATKAGLTAFEAFKEGIAGIFNGIGNIILGAFGAIYDSVTGIANRIPGVALPAWEEVSRGFEFGADKIKGSAESASTALSTASGNMATSASTASANIGGSLTAVAGSVDTAKTSYTDFAGYSSTYMTQAAGTTQSYSDQMIAAFGNLPPAAAAASSEVALALGGVTTAAQAAQTGTDTATTSLIDGVLAKMNGLAGQVTGPRQTFDDLQATVSGSSAVIQTDLDTMLSGWNSTFTEMATAPVVAGQTMTAGWKTGVEGLAPITTDALTATAAAASTGFQAVQFAGDTALAAMNLNATTQMDALNTTVSTGLTALQTSAATNYTTLQTQDLAYQTATTTGQQTFYATLTAQDLAYQTNATTATQTFVTGALTAWQAMSTGVQGHAFAMTTTVQTRFGEFYLWLVNLLTVLLIPAVSLSFDTMYLNVVTQMAAMASAMQAGWLSMLGGTRSSLTSMRSEVNSQMSGMVGELRGYAGEMAGVGAAIGQGLADGIESKIGAAIAAAIALVQAAIAAAWAAAMAQSPSRIMMELGGYFGEGFSIGVEDQGPDAAGAAAGIVAGAVQAAKDAAGIHSPSTAMAGVGWDFIMGLLQGIKKGDKEAILAVTELMDKIMGTISNIVKALGDLGGFKVQAMDLSGFTAQIKQVVAAFKVLAGVYAKKDSGLDSAKAVLEPLGEIFSEISSIVSGVKSLFDPELLKGTLTDAKKVIDLLIGAAKLLVTGFAAAAKALKDEAWPEAVALASVAGSIAGNIKSVVEALNSMGDVAVFGSMKAPIDNMVAFVVDLVRSFAVAGGKIDAKAKTAAGEFASTVAAVVDPVIDAVDALNKLAGFTFRPIGPVAEKIANAMLGLSQKMRWIAEKLGPEAIGFSKAGAGLVKEVVEPWSKAIDTLDDLARFVFVAIGPAAELIANAMQGLAGKLAGLATDLGPEMVANAKAGAALMTAVVAPWKAAVDALVSLASFVFRPVGPVGEQIKGAVYGLARKLAFLSQQLGPQMVEDARTGAALMAEVVKPWQDAVDTLVSLASIVFRPVGPTAERISDAVFGLARKLTWIVDRLGPVLMAAAKDGAALMADVLKPWEDAVKVFVALSEFVFRPIGPTAEKIKRAVIGLSSKLRWIVDRLGPEIMTLAKEGALLMAAVLVPWEDAIKTFTALAEFVFRPVGPTAERIKNAVKGLASKLRWVTLWLGSDVMALAKDGAALMASVLAPWEDAIKVFSAMAEFVFRPVGPAAERMKNAVKGLARKLNFLVDGLGPDMIARAKIGAALMIEVLAPWEDAVKTFSAMAAFIFRPIGPISSRMVHMVEGLARKLARMADTLGPDTIALAKDGAALIAAVLEPWQDAVETLDVMADYVFRPVGPIADKIIFSVGSLALKLADVAFHIGPQAIALAKEGAELFSAVLVPWQDAITTLDAMAGYVARPILGIADKIILAVGGLALKLAQVAFHLGPQTIALAREGAALLSDVLTPWQDAITVLGALAGFIYRSVDKSAKDVTAAMILLANALAGMADDIGMGTLKKAAKVGALLSEVLAPWETAMKVADNMRAFRIMPDFVDKMVRFGRQWIDIVDQLGRIILTLNQDGLAAVEAFAGVLTALLDGLTVAMEIVERGDFPMPDAGIWDRFVAWVWGIFQFFYDKVQELMNDPENTLGFDPVLQFAGALESIMNALSAAVDLARNFEFVLPDAEVFLNFENWVWGIFQFFWAKVQELWNDPDRIIGFDPVVAFAEALSSILGALSSALELARNFEFVLPDPELWAAFVTWVWGIFQTFFTLVQTLWSDPTRIIDFVPVEAFGSALESIMGGLSAGLELARGFVFTAPPADQWSAFVTWVWGAFQTFYALVQTLWLDPASIIEFDPVESFGSALESIMGGLLASMELITGFSFTPPDPGQWDAFIAWVIAAFQTVYDYVESLVTDPTTALNFDPEESFGSALESIMGGLMATIDLITNFVWTPPDPELWSDFIGWVLTFMDDLRLRIIAAFPMDAGAAAAFAPVAAFGDAVEAVTGGLQTALEFFSNLAGYIPVSETTINTFLGNVEFLIDLVGTYATQHLDPARVIALQRFEAAISATAGGLSDALDLFEGLASLDDRTIDWLANAGAGTGTNTGAAMQVIGYLFQAIVQTMTRFGTEVATLSLTSWTPTANAFFTALETVIGILSDALGLFTDLGTSGMPSTAEIEAFVAAIMQVFTTFNTGLASVTTPLHTAILAVQTELSVNLAGWLATNGAASVGHLFYDAAVLVPTAIAAGLGSVSLVQPSIDLRQQVVDNVHGWFSYHAAALDGRLFFEDGSNVVLSIGAGMLDQEDYIYQVAWDIGQAIINGLEGSLQIGSPSRLAMEAGWFTSDGLALGLLAGKDNAVSAAREVADAVAAEYTSLGDRPSVLWPNLSSTSPTFAQNNTIEHEVVIRVEGGDALPKMTDYEMRELARELGRQLKQGV